MPTKNTIKTYIENGYYHLYNRGVDKREIFLDQNDCAVFLYYLKIYLSSPEILLKDHKFLSPRLLYKISNLNLSNEVFLLSFALMPNHFHLQVKQISKNGIEKIMRRVVTAYAQYFNKKYKRIGTLFESTYKAVLIETDQQHLYLSCYIHRNPMKLKNAKFDFLEFSSYPYYLGTKHADWIKPEEIMAYFRSPKNTTANDLLSYQNFVESFTIKHLETLKDITLEEEESL